MYPSSPSESSQIENKIIILYLLDKMDVPLTNSQITQFAISESFMNYYYIQLYLKEMVDSGYLETSTDQNSTRYTISDEGYVVLDAFERNLSQPVKNRIIKYIADNIKDVKKDFKVTANYFFDASNNNEYMVKCGIHDDDIFLFEVSLSVVSKDQAVKICNNWRNNVDNVYGKMMDLLLQRDKKVIKPELDK